MKVKRYKRRKTSNVLIALERIMRPGKMDRLDISCLVLLAISVVFIVIFILAHIKIDLINIFSFTLYTILAFFAIHGVLVLWTGRQNFKTGYIAVVKWTLIISLILAMVITLTYTLTDTTVTIAWLRLRPIENFINSSSLAGVTLLFFLLWAYLIALAWFFVCALTGGIWIAVKAQRKYLPVLFIELKKLTFDETDTWSRRTAAWIIQILRYCCPQHWCWNLSQKS